MYTPRSLTALTAQKISAKKENLIFLHLTFASVSLGKPLGPLLKVKLLVGYI